MEEQNHNQFCQLCESHGYRKLGIRGNREYFGARLQEEPHYVTDVVKCSSCGFIFCSPSLPIATVLETEYYRDKFSDVTCSKVDDDIYHFGFSVARRHQAKGRWLDVGAGRGEIVHLATLHGYEAIGVEPSFASRGYARKNFNLSLIPGFLLSNNPLPGVQFEVISMFHVLEHIARPKELLAIAKSRLTSDGILYIEVPNGDALLLRLADFYFKIIGKGWSTRLSPLHPPFHTVAYSPKSLHYLLERLGFTVRELKTYTPRCTLRGDPSVKSNILSAVRNILSKLLSSFPNGEVVYAVVSVSKAAARRSKSNYENCSIVNRK